MNYVIEQIPIDLLTSIKDGVNKFSKDVRPMAIKIKDEDKKGIRAMAEGREGYVRLVAKVATQHEKFLSRADSASDLNNVLKYYDDLSATRLAIMELLEYIDGTQWGAGVDCMKYADKFNSSLQNQRDESAIDTSMNEIDDWNKRYGRDTSSADNTPPNT